MKFDKKAIFLILLFICSFLISFTKSDMLRLDSAHFSHFNVDPTKLIKKLEFDFDNLSRKVDVIIFF